MKINSNIELTTQKERITLLEDNGTLISIIKRNMIKSIEESFKNDIKVSNINIDFKINENSIKL